jgi:hypothetical protein
MMTKTKRSDRNDHSKYANSEDIAVTAANSAESSSAVSVSTDQTVNQPSQENSSNDFDMAVRELAYFKWEAAGFPEGDGFDFWLEAERELRANQPPSTPTPE